MFGISFIEQSELGSAQLLFSCTKMMLNNVKWVKTDII